MIRALQAFFAEKPHRFEACAAAIARMMLPDIASIDLTRPSRDGGPIIIIAASDIAQLLRINGQADAKSVEAWLQRAFPEAE